MSHSPVPNKTPDKDLLNKIDRREMSFPEAIQKLMDGEKITRKSWGDEGFYGFLKDSLVVLHKAGQEEKTVYTWIINDGDLFATDWVVVNSLN